MMIEATAIATASPAPVAEDMDAGEAAPRWAVLGADLRFFLICYLAGLIVFLVMLS
jgi:hypothetical protein